MYARCTGALLLLLAASLSACAEHTVEPDRVVRLDLEATATVVVVGDSVRFAATPIGRDGDTVDVPVVWSSSDTAIAAVTNDGWVRARTPGRATISAEAGGSRATSNVDVVALGGGDLAFFAEVRSLEDPSRVEGSVTVSNLSSRTITLEVKGVCAVALLIFDNPYRTGPPVWDELTWHNSRPGGCKWLPETVSLDAGASATFATESVPPPSILGDTLAAGTYYTAVRLELLSPVTEEVVVPAGAVDVTSLQRDSSAPLQTHALSHRLEEGFRGWEVSIPFTYTNPTSDTVYVAGCHPGPERAQLSITLELQDGEQWIRAWSPILTLCLSPPFLIEPSASYTDTLWVFGGYPDENVAPKFHVGPESGVYRLVWSELYSTYDPDAQPFGERLPKEQRVSNPFWLSVP